MNFSGADRTRQLITVGVGTVLLLVMSGVLIAGFRLATQMNAKVQALQTAMWRSREDMDSGSSLRAQ